MEKIKLGNCATYINGYAFKPTDWKKSGIPIIRIQDLTKSNSNPNYYDGKLDEKYIVKNGDVLISWSGSLGVYEWNGDIAYLNQHIFKVKFDKKEINKNYFIYLVESKIHEMLKNVHGSTMKHITKSNFDNIDINLHTINEQEEIANKITMVKDIINIRKEQLENLERLIKSQFVEMFKSKNYEKKRIGDFGKFQGGYAFKSKDFSENGIKLVQISNVNKDNLDWNEINRLPEEYIEKYKDYALNVGDVVMAMTRPIIKSLNEVKIAYVSENDVPCLLNQRVGRFLIDENKISKSYLTYCCKMDDFKNYVEKMSGNSLQPNISSKQVEDYTIEIPPIEEQNKFSEFVKLIDKQKFVIVEIIMFYDIILRSILNNIMG